jgi:hypothetical protein
MRILPPFLVLLLALATLGMGIRFGTFAAGGADSYAYVSQARLWLKGNPRIEQPWVRQLSFQLKEVAAAPLGYRPISADGTIVPTVAPGLPLLMSLFERIFGANGPFLVVPLLGALAIWFTYLLGRDVTLSRGVGLGAAAMLLTSPVFLCYVMQPMTDVPMATGWTLTCWLALREPRRLSGSPAQLSRSAPWSFSAGLVAGSTLLIRPNLVALALVPPAAWMWPCVRRLNRWRTCLLDMLIFFAGLLPGLLAIAFVNDRLYGSPFVSGYGRFRDLYSFDPVLVNLKNYGLWLIQAQTPLIFLAVVPFVLRGSLRDDSARSSARAGLGALIVLTALSYVFYSAWDAWFYLRFLLPALPAVFILTVAGIRSLASKLPSPLHVLVGGLVYVVLVAFSLKAGFDWSIFGQRASEQRYVKVARFVERFTTPNSVFIATQHSGSLRYYANRLTLRWDALPEGHLDWAIQELKEAGYRPYILLDHTEEPRFVARFAARNAAGKLDWRPIADIKGNTDVRIYDPGERLAAAEWQRKMR